MDVRYDRASFQLSALPGKLSSSMKGLWLCMQGVVGSNVGQGLLFYPLEITKHPMSCLFLYTFYLSAGNPGLKCCGENVFKREVSM